MPVQCEYYALEGLAQLLESVERIRGALNPGLALTGLLLTMFDRRTRLSGDVEREVRSALRPARSSRPSCRAPCGWPRRRVTACRSRSTTRNSRSADAYYRLALEVVERG